MTDTIANHIGTLGLQAEDAVTGFKGIITSISFDLYGCIQVVVVPRTNDDGKIKDGQWFDISRLNIVSDTPVITVPDFSQGYIAEGKKGCAEKPAR